MQKFSDKLSSQKSSGKGAKGQVRKTKKPKSKTLSSTRRRWGLAARLEYSRTKGKRK